VLAELDHQMGRLFTGLRELGLHESTLVVFTSDNGAHPNYRGKRNGGLRGRKTCLYEGGIRMPCLVRWPGHVPAGKVDETSVWSGLDLFPTVCALAGVACPPEPALDGEDRSGVLLGTPSARRRPLSFEYGRNEAAFAYPTGRERSPQLAVRDGQWKLLVNADGSGAELYDVVADPRETRDLAADQPALAARLKDLVLAWRRSLP
jgi:arylsulfatase A-like enzyme